MDRFIKSSFNFEKYNELLGEEPLVIDDFTEVLDAGLSAASVAVIPPGYDSVTFGDIERTRLNHIKILFLSALMTGLFPSLRMQEALSRSMRERRCLKRIWSLHRAPESRLSYSGFICTEI